MMKAQKYKTVYLLLLFLTSILMSCNEKAGGFQFSIAVDFSKLKVDKEYLLNPENYEIKSEDKFFIEVKESENIKFLGLDKAKVKAQNVTHIITLYTDLLMSTRQDVEICLKKRIPKWVKESSTIDDSNIEQDTSKTLGIEYLITGVSSAYYTLEPEQTNYISFKVSLKR